MDVNVDVVWQEMGSLHDAFPLRRRERNTLCHRQMPVGSAVIGTVFGFGARVRCSILISSRSAMMFCLNEAFQRAADFRQIVDAECLRLLIRGVGAKRPRPAKPDAKK
jgi:hypothetical protein